MNPSIRIRPLLGWCVAILLVVTICQTTALAQDTAELDGDNLDALLELADQDIAQLDRVRVTAPALDVEVSTVSRQKSTIGRSPAAVFVITNDMIRRSGARSIPEVLRMAPGVHVARIDANKWAISIRGFSGRFANKLLVQIDGRTVYTPLFAGVFWDVQDMLLEDVERIEVIRGPGATVWGPNAVNGVINIISKPAAKTQGIYANAGAGTEERGFGGGRIGGSSSRDLHYRVYGKGFDRDEGYDSQSNAHDDWRMARAGGRMDWTPSCVDTLTLQGDIYEGDTGRRNFYPSPTAPTFASVVDDDAHVAGGNVLLRWTRTLDKDREWSLQTYYDRTERSYGQSPFREFRDTVDVDFQYRFRLGENHSIISGLGYRNTKDKIRNSFPISFLPTSRAIDLFSYFIQDEITLLDDELYLTLGSKFNHSDFTPFEYQPTARIVWLPTERHSIWGAVSRAVRMPSRADENVRALAIPQTVPGLFPTLTGNPALKSEDLLAFELGFRSQLTERFSWDWAFYYNKYDNLITSGIAAPTPVNVPPIVLTLPLPLNNGGHAESFGFEVTTNYEVQDAWRLRTSYSYLDMRDTVGNVAVYDSARNIAYLQSSWDILCDWELDLIYRYVDSLPRLNVPSYNTMDVRVSWIPTSSFELSVVGRNLLDGQHPEFASDAVTGNVATEVQREMYVIANWRY